MKKILVVDDEINIINTISEVLKKNKFKPLISHGGRKALELFSREKPDLVLLDIWMADIDGYTLLNQFKKINPQVPVIMMSGHANVATSVETVKLGAEDFLEKPFSSDYLIFKIYQYLKSPFQKKDVASRNNLKLDNLLQESLEYQKTISKNLVITGRGLHRGTNTGIILSPLPENSGIIFKDISTGETIKANIESIASSNFYGTTLKSRRFTLTVIEHLLSALNIYEIDNLQIKVSEEIPILDGSSFPFCQLIEEGEIIEQKQKRKAVVIDKKYTYQDPTDSTIFISIEPADNLAVSYSLEFPQAFGEQFFFLNFAEVKNKTDFYKKEIAPCRTFGFLDETKNLQASGMAQGANLDNALLVHQDKVINAQLKFKNEFARHKILDIMGDLYLFGYQVQGKVIAKKSGHRHTIELIKQVML